jgi:hypothetical protein
MTWKPYRKTATTMMRPYVPSEDTSNISVDVGYTPKLGDMVASDGKTSWLINQSYFDTNYEEVEGK